jgi:Staphylococcal nuclease homologue
MERRGFNSLPTLSQIAKTIPLPLPARACIRRASREGVGDTLKVLDYQHVQHKIKLAGIDAPEKKQPFGTESREALASKVFGKEVLFAVEKHRDRYGRLSTDARDRLRQFQGRSDQTERPRSLRASASSDLVTGKVRSRWTPARRISIAVKCNRAALGGIDPGGGTPFCESKVRLGHAGPIFGFGESGSRRNEGGGRA